MMLIWILVLSNALGPARTGNAHMRIIGNAMGLCLWQKYELSMSHQTVLFIYLYLLILFISVCMSFGLYAELN